MITKSSVKSAVSESLKARSRSLSGSALNDFKWKVVDATGRSLDTVDRWLAGETEPDFHDGLNLFEHFGTPFVNEVLGLGSYIAARREHAEAIDAANNEATAQTALTVIIGVAEDAKSKLRAVAG